MDFIEYDYYLSSNNTIYFAITISIMITIILFLNSKAKKQYRNNKLIIFVKKSNNYKLSN